MGKNLSNEEKELLLNAKRKGFKGLTAQERDAVLKYKNLLSGKKREDESSKENILTTEDKRLLMNAKKKGMKSLTPMESRAVLKYKRLTKKLADKKSIKDDLPVIREEIPDIPVIKREHFSKFRGKKILIAEDNKINQKMLGAILSTSGIDIVFAENGKVALKNLSEGLKCDLILMDIEMPEIDGITATKTIRRSKHFSNLPIVALTSSTNSDDIDRIMDAGMNAYLFKPVVLGKLYNVFRVFMTRR